MPAGQPEAVFYMKRFNRWLALKITNGVSTVEQKQVKADA
jgi:hypothetical protein